MAVFDKINYARLAVSLPFPIFFDAKEKIRDCRAVSYQFNCTDITIVSHLTLVKTIFEFFEIRSKNVYHFKIDFPRV